MSTKSEKRAGWGVPVFGLVFGLVAFLGAGSQGEWGLGLAFLVIMVGYVAALLAFRRFEPFAMLSKEGGEDERHRMLQLRAGYFSVNAVAFFAIGGFLVELIRGGDYLPYALVSAVGGFSFMGALVFLSRRG